MTSRFRVFSRLEMKITIIYIGLIFVIIVFAGIGVGEYVYADNFENCTEVPLSKIEAKMVGEFWLVFANSADWPLRGLSVSNEFEVTDRIYQTTKVTNVTNLNAINEESIYFLAESGNRWIVAGYESDGDNHWMQKPVVDFMLSKELDFYFYDYGGENKSSSLVVGDDNLFVSLTSLPEMPDSDYDWNFLDYYLFIYGRDGDPKMWEFLSDYDEIDHFNLVDDGEGGAIGLFYLNYLSDTESGNAVRRYGRDGDILFEIDFRDDPMFDGWLVNTMASDGEGGAFLGIESDDYPRKVYIYHLMAGGECAPVVALGGYYNFINHKMAYDGTSSVYIAYNYNKLLKVNTEGDIDWSIKFAESTSDTRFYDYEIASNNVAYILFSEDDPSGNESNDITRVSAIGATGAIDWTSKIYNQSGRSFSSYVKHVEGVGLFVVGNNCTGTYYSCDLAISVLDEETGEEIWSYVRDVEETCWQEDKEEKEEEACGCGS